MKEMMTDWEIQNRLIGKGRRKERINNDYFHFMTKVLTDLGVPGADDLTEDDIEAISDEEVTTFLRDTYGAEMGSNLSSFEKKLIYLSIKRGI